MLYIVCIYKLYSPINGGSRGVVYIVQTDTPLLSVKYERKKIVEHSKFAMLYALAQDGDITKADAT
jgi:hypothetical protein